MESWYPDQLHLALASQIAQRYLGVNVSLWVLRQNQVVKSLYSFSKALGERWSLRKTLYPYSYSNRGVCNDKQSLVLPEMCCITIGTIGGLLIRLAIWSIFWLRKGTCRTSLSFVSSYGLHGFCGAWDHPHGRHRFTKLKTRHTEVGPGWDHVGQEPKRWSSKISWRCKSCYGAFPQKKGYTHFMQNTPYFNIF